MDAERIGLVCCSLGAGRRSKDDEIDYTAGLEMLKKTGERVEKGEAVAILYTSKEVDMEAHREEYLGALSIDDSRFERPPLIAEIIF